MADALYAYNPSRRYVRAVSAYASQLRANSRAFLGYYHWQVFYGDTLLPEGLPGPVGHASPWLIAPVGAVGLGRSRQVDLTRSTDSALLHARVRAVPLLGWGSAA
jgi:hypothetical protein